MYNHGRPWTAMHQSARGRAVRLSSSGVDNTDNHCGCRGSMLCRSLMSGRYVRVAAKRVFALALRVHLCAATLCTLSSQIYCTSVQLCTCCAA